MNVKSRFFLLSIFGLALAGYFADTYCPRGRWASAAVGASVGRNRERSRCEDRIQAMQEDLADAQARIRELEQENKQLRIKCECATFN